MPILLLLLHVLWGKHMLWGSQQWLRSCDERLLLRLLS